MTSRNPGGDKRSVEFQVVKRPARDRIFETAKDMFYERGIRAVGVDSIAAEADATKMTLYRNFPSRTGSSPR
jgi:AcrR family transcriptional regulator